MAEDNSSFTPRPDLPFCACQEKDVPLEDLERMIQRSWPGNSAIFPAAVDLAKGSRDTIIGDVPDTGWSVDFFLMPHRMSYVLPACCEDELSQIVWEHARITGAFVFGSDPQACPGMPANKSPQKAQSIQTSRTRIDVRSKEQPDDIGYIKIGQYWVKQGPGVPVPHLYRLFFRTACSKCTPLTRPRK